MSGFVIIHRSLWEHPAFRDFSEASAFAWMVSAAAWKPVRVRYKGRMIDLRRGQLAVSFRDLSEQFNWSLGRAQRYISRLTTDAMVDTCSDTGIMIVTICNYDKFQGSCDATDTLSDTGPIQDRYTEQRREQVSKKESPNGDSYTPDSPPCEPDATDAEPAPVSEDIPSMVDAWNDLANELGLPRVQRMTRTRTAKARARLRDCGGLDGWRIALAKIRGSPGLRGDNDRGWKADFDWMTTESSFTKLMEGKYDGWSSGKAGNGNGGRSSQGDRQAAFFAALGSMARG